MGTPIAIDIDGTLTRGDGSLDPRSLEALYNLDNLAIIVTGKVFPNAEVLCRFAGIEQRIVAENGGIVFVDENLEITVDGKKAKRVAEEYKERGYKLGWGKHDLPNRWRETEIVVNRTSPLDPLKEIAEKYNMQVVDTGYAYHVKSPNVDKASGIKKVADILDLNIKDFVAIGDSESDIPAFKIVGTSYAVANASEEVKKIADKTMSESYADGFLEALKIINGKES